MGLLRAAKARCMQMQSIHGWVAHCFQDMAGGILQTRPPPLTFRQVCEGPSQSLPGLQAFDQAWRSRPGPDSRAAAGFFSQATQRPQLTRLQVLAKPPACSMTLPSLPSASSPIKGSDNSHLAVSRIKYFVGEY